MTWYPDPPADPPPADPPPADPDAPAPGAQGPQPVATVGQTAGELAGQVPDGTPMQPGWHDGEWCADFVKYYWGKAGADTDGITGAAHSFADYGQTHGTRHTDRSYQPQVGDAVVYGYQHVNIVVAVNLDGSVVLEDGNWSDQTHREAPRQIHVGATNDGGQVATDIVSPVPKGGIPLTTATDNGVVSGPDQQLVAVADPSTLHEGGLPVVTGSSTVFVGPDQAPLARHGDRTADGGTIVDQTDEGVYAGG